MGGRVQDEAITAALGFPGVDDMRVGNGSIIVRPGIAEQAAIWIEMQNTS